MAEPIAPHIPEGLWVKCPGCKETLFARELERNARICPFCQFHFPLNATERAQLVAEPDSLRPFRGAGAELWTGIGSWEGVLFALGIVAPEEKREYRSPNRLLQRLFPLIDRAARARHPLVVFCPGGYGLASGEALRSPLLAAWNQRLRLLSEHQLPYLLVLTDPSPEHGYRTLLPLGDLVLGEAAPEETPSLGDPLNGVPAEAPYVDRFAPRPELIGELAKLLTFFTDPMRIHG